MEGISLNVRKLSPAQQRRLFEQLPKAKYRTDYEIIYPYWHLQYDNRRKTFVIDRYPKKEVSFNEFMEKLLVYRMKKKGVVLKNGQWHY